MHNQRKRRKDKRIQVKIGHGGTLDPLATGVLIAGIGKGTKSLQDFLTCTKVYETVVLFGTSTDTYDRVGKVLKRAPHAHVTKEMVEEALEQFRGKFMQLPPLYSALKMNGKPLYEYAREGKEIPREIERRAVEVLNLEMVEWMEGGTHEHVAPTDEAGHAEVNVANKLWKQENALPKAPRKSRSPVPQASKEEVTATEPVADSKKPADETVAQAVVDSETKVKDEGIAKPATTEDGDVAMEDVPASSALRSTTEIEANSSAKRRPSLQDTQASPTEEATEAEAREDFEQQKRKLSEDQDDLVRSNTKPKRPRKNAPESTADTAMMSGGLAEADGSDPQTSIEKSPPADVKGPPAVRLRMTVTSGFYVRSLCHDLGAAVGSAALMAELERTRQGAFELGKNVLEYEKLKEGEKVWGPLVEEMLDDWHKKGEKSAPKSELSESKGEMSESKVEES